MQIRPNVILPMFQNTYTDLQECDFFSSPEVLNSTDTAKSYLSDQFKIDMDKYSTIEFGWECENRSDYSFFTSDFNDGERRSSKSRSPSDFRGNSEDKIQRNSSNERGAQKNTNSSKLYSKVNSKRKAEGETYDLDYKEPKPKKKSTKYYEGWDHSLHANNGNANNKVDEILGLTTVKHPSCFLSTDPSLESQNSLEFFTESYCDQPETNDDSSYAQNTSKETTDNSLEISSGKGKIKNYISTTSNGFALVLAKHGRDPQEEIHQILSRAIKKNLAVPNENMFNWHLENILQYSKDKIEGKTNKTTAKGNSWRQNKVSNKTEIYNVFHPQEGDEPYILGIKKVLRDTLEVFFNSGCFLKWVDEYYKTDKASSKSFFKNPDNIKEIAQVYLSQQKWRSRFI